MVSQRKTPRHRAHLAAEAVLVKGEVYQWEVPICPLCGRKHLHGAGPLSKDPRPYLFHRVAHCWEKPSAEVLGALKVLNCDDGGYVLVDKDPDQTEAVWCGRKTRAGRAA